MFRLVIAEKLHWTLDVIDNLSLEDLGDIEAKWAGEAWAKEHGND